MPELKPCPLCGSTNVDPAEWMNGNGETGPGCSDCGATGPDIERWNRRALPEGMALVPRAITAETGHKAGMVGDFAERWMDDCTECSGSGLDDECQECHVCEGAGVEHCTMDVSWTTIKAIHRRVVEIAEGAES